MLNLNQMVLELEEKERLRGRKRLLPTIQDDTFLSKQSASVEYKFRLLIAGVV